VALENKVTLEFKDPTVYFWIFLGESPSFDVFTKIKSASFGENRTSKSLKPDGRSTGISDATNVVKLYT
jgi:hypothetical protein